MNKELIRTLSIYGAAFTVILGSILHFVYDWTGNNLIVGFFSPVNESPWEHMKMAFTPLVTFAFIDYYYLRSTTKNYCFALAKQIGIAIVFTLAIFYVQIALLGESILWVDITSFVLGIMLAKYLGYKILTGSFKNWEFKGLNTISAILLILITAFFIYATINPPRTGLFFDKTSGVYGIGE